MANIYLNRMFNSKFILYLVLFFSFFVFFFGGLLKYDNLISGYEAYILYMNSNACRFLIIFFVMVCITFPYRDTHIVVRLGKERWLKYEVKSMIGVIALFNFFVAGACFVLFGKLSNGWSKDFMICYMNRGNWLDAKLGEIGDLSGWVMFDTPFNTFLFSLLLVFLWGVIAGLICMFFNVVGRPIYGPCIVALIYYSKYIRIPQFGNCNIAWLKFIKLFEAGTLSNLNKYFYGGNLSGWIIVLWYSVLIIFLCELIMRFGKKMEV